MPTDKSGILGQPPARLEIRLLGAVEAILDGRRLRALSSPRLQRFLARVALGRGPLERPRLAFELWPDSGEGQARTNLRKLLHELRRSLPDVDEFVEIDNEIVRWIPTGPSRVDVLRFRYAVAAGDLELAARLYGGDLLPACYDDWVLEERAKLRAEALEALQRLTEKTAGRSEHQATIRHTRRIIELEPTDEAAVRTQMEAHLALGNRAAALRCYHRYAEVMQRELGVTPGEAIDATYREVRAGTGTAPHAPVQHTAPTAESPFVGRDVELERLEEAWRAARESGAHLVLVTGEPGIGKSRLALELGRRVRAAGDVVATARAYEAAGRLPWGPVVDLLRSDALRSHVDTLDTVWRGELARLLPEIQDPASASEPSGSRDPVQRHRLFDAVSRAIVAGDRPRLLIIDDLQWCDIETIELIGFVVRSAATAIAAAPILIVGTVRSEEVPSHHPLVRLIEALDRDQTVTSMPLDRLDETATATLAAQLRDEETLDPALAARLWSETEGNPLFVIEAVRAGISADESQTMLTPTMRAVLGARLEQLPEAARRVTEVAAVIGRPFSLDLMTGALGVGETELVEPVDELWRRRIIRDQGATYDFTHDKLRAVALEMIAPARRRQLHRAVAEAIGSERHAASPRLAAHYDQAGMVEPAIEAYRVAGARAVAVSAIEEAVTSFRRALTLIADVPSSPDRDVLELDLRIALGSPLVALEGYGSKAAHRLYERALTLCRKLERPVDPPILRGLGLARLQGCRFDDCDELAQALLDEARKDPIAKTEGRYLLGVSGFWQGDLDRARSYLRGAIEAYDLPHRDRHLALFAQDPKAVCLVRLALVELWTGDAGRAGETARAALEIAAELDHLMTSAYVITYAAIGAAEAEDLGRLAQLLAQADLLWQRFSDRYLMVVLEALRGWLEVCQGSAGGIEKILRSVERSRGEGETLHLTYTLLLLARARAVSGELHEGRAATREGLEWTQRSNQRYLEAELWRVDGELAYLSGEPQVAAASLQNAVETATAQGAGWLSLRALHSSACRFPDRAARERLEELVKTLPSGHDLPAFQAANDLLNKSG